MRPVLTLNSPSFQGIKRASTFKRTKPVAAMNIATRVVRCFGSIGQASRAMEGVNQTSIRRAIEAHTGRGTRTEQYPRLNPHYWIELENPITLEMANDEVNVRRSTLSWLKTVDHPAVLGTIAAPDAAGFVDADGCLHLTAGERPRLLRHAEIPAHL